MDKRFTVMLVVTLATVFSGCRTVQTESIAKEPMQTSKRFQGKITRSVQLDYLLHLPAGYSAQGIKEWPLMLFLHGSGERGSNVNKVAAHGPPKVVKTMKDFPFILISPQCPTDATWRDDELNALLDDVISKHRVDTNRIYVTGLSMGGYGSWSLGTRYPERFAAIAPICGGGEQIPILLASREKKAAMRTMGVWAFHGAKDPVVAVEESQRMTNAMMRAGCNNVKLTIYSDAGHDSWTQAYAEPEIWNWFLAHRRGQ